MSVTLTGDWLEDDLLPGQMCLLEVTQRLENTRTRFQKAEVVETKAFGRSLVLDGSIQTAEADEWIYHESLVHPALISCPASGEVAILGGGEGATLRETLRHRWVERAHMVDIDAEVVQFCRDHLPSFHQGAFDDPRTELVIGDARAWIENRPDASLTAVIFDITEPLAGGPAQKLFTREFYQQVRRTLVPGGSFGMHAGPVLLQRSPFADLLPGLVHTLSEVFSRVVPLASYIHAYSDMWTFILAGDDQTRLPADSQEIDRRLGERIAGSLKHYDGECHRHMSSFPKYVRAIIDRPVQAYTDAHPPALEY